MKHLARIVFLPDLHFGNPRINAKMLHQHMTKYVYPKLKECDLLVIGGDFFHDLVGLNSLAGYHAIFVIDEFIRLAKEYKFYIRIVRGTFSHDHVQNKAFIRSGSDADWKPYSDEQIDGKPLIAYYNTVALELGLLGMDLLFIPDNLPYDNVMDHIYELFNKDHLKQVDLVISHGYFKHLLPSGVPVPKNTLCQEDFKDLVKGCVLNGHVHIPSIFKNVVSGGSFERMAHGEEEAKGFFYIVYNTDTNTTSFDFIENKDALIFKTFNLEKMSDEDFKKKFSSLVEKAVNDIHIRLIVDDPIRKSAMLGYIEEAGAKINKWVSTMKSKDAERYTASEKISMDVASLPKVSEENLPDLIVAFLEAKGDYKLKVDDVKQILSNKQQ